MKHSPYGINFLWMFCICRFCLHTNRYFETCVNIHSLVDLFAKLQISVIDYCCLIFKQLFNRYTREERTGTCWKDGIRYQWSNELYNHSRSGSSPANVDLSRFIHRTGGGDKLLATESSKLMEIQYQRIFENTDSIHHMLKWTNEFDFSQMLYLIGLGKTNINFTL